MFQNILRLLDGAGTIGADILPLNIMMDGWTQVRTRPLDRVRSLPEPSHVCEGQVTVASARAASLAVQFQ